MHNGLGYGPTFYYQLNQYNYDYRDCEYFILNHFSNTHYTECLKNPYNYAHYFVYYNVTFYSNGSSVKSQSVRRGQSASAPSVTRTGYSFEGWDRTFTSVQSNISVNAIWELEIFDVTFVDHDNNTLLIETLNPGENPTPPDPPTRGGYRFTGWSQSMENISSATTVSAQYIKIWNTIFKNFEGDTIKEEVVDEGTNVAPPSDPTRSGYTFNGWSQDLNNITADRVFDPQWLKNLNISFLGKDGSEIDSTVLPEGSDVEPLVAPVVEGFLFKEWSHSLNNISEDTTYQAIYEKAYTVRFLDEDENVLKEEAFFQNTHAVQPSVTMRAGFVFAGWDRDIRNLTENLVVHPIYRPRGLTSFGVTSKSSLLDINNNQNISFWVGTLAEYDNITKNPNIIYFIRDGNTISQIKSH